VLQGLLLRPELIKVKREMGYDKLQILSKSTASVLKTRITEIVGLEEYRWVIFKVGLHNTFAFGCFH
jgi:hypothetical protein